MLAAVVCAIGMWQVEHLSCITSDSSGRSITSERTDACQYGSRAAFAIIVARQELSIETSTPVSSVRFVWQTAQEPDVEKSSPTSIASGSPLRAPSTSASTVGVTIDVAVGGGVLVG